MSALSARSAADPVLNSARQCLFRFSALALADPKTGNWDALTSPDLHRTLAAAAEVVRDEPAAAAASLARGELGLDQLDPTAAIRELPATDNAFNTLYESVFGLLVSGSCPPHETEYIHSKLTFQRSHSLADIAGYYRAFGLRLSRCHPERQDHVALQLEFVAQLFELENRAIAANGANVSEPAEVCRSARKRFFAEHLACWVPTFARLLAIENPGGFYDMVGRFLAALIPAERALLGIAAMTHSVAPSQVERPEDCEGCAIHDEIQL